MRKREVVLSFLSGILIGVFLLGGYKISSSSRVKKDVFAPTELTAGTSDVVSLQSAFVKVAKMVKPAVVQITTEKVITYRYWDPFGDLEEFFKSPFDEFFGIPKRKRSPRTFKKKQEGLGSGFIVDEKGYILTNNHVIKGVDKIYVKLFNDDHKYPAKVIGTDPKTDLALIKIKVKRPLPTVKLGDSDKIQVGEWAMAIGNPMGLTETVTVGVISAKGRSGFGITQYEDFIQTDAAINPGNSGGPLVNIKGEVIGINTFIIAPYAAQNIGFAIPINLAKQVFSQLKEKGKVIRGYLGVWLQPLNEELAKSFGLKEAKGALVAQVIKDTPAEKAGIKEGDIIIKFDGKDVKDVRDLQMKVANTPVGKRVSVVVWRDGKEKVVKVIVGEMPEEEKIASAPGEELWRGMKVSSIDEEAKNKFGIEEDKGVVVIYVEPGTPAEESGIVPGTVIKMIDNYRISSISDFNKVIRKIPKKKDVRLWIIQNNQGRFIILKGEK